MTRQPIKLSARTALAAGAVLLAAVVLDGAVLAQGAAAEKIELPPYKNTLKDDYYPPDARQHYRQGRALVEFTLDGRGVPTNVVVVKSEPAREFADSARRLVKSLRFEVPADWGRGGAAAHRFSMGVRFQVIQCLNFSHCESQARNPPADYDEAARMYVVSTERRVLTFDGKQPEAAPAPLPGRRDNPASSPQPTYAPRAQDVPDASAEPNYPPG